MAGWSVSLAGQFACLAMHKAMCPWCSNRSKHRCASKCVSASEDQVRWAGGQVTRPGSHDMSGSARVTQCGVWLLGIRRVLASCVCAWDVLCQQLEWGCSLGGTHNQVSAAEETGIQQQLLDIWAQRLSSAAGGIHTVHICVCVCVCVYLYIYIYIHVFSPADIHPPRPQRGSGWSRRCCLCSCDCCVHLSGICVADHVYRYICDAYMWSTCMCLLWIHLQPCCWLNLGPWQQLLHSQAVESGLMFFPKKCNYLFYLINLYNLIYSALIDQY